MFLSFSGQTEDRVIWDVAVVSTVPSIHPTSNYPNFFHLPLSSDSVQINQRLSSGGCLSSLQLSTIPGRHLDQAKISCQAHHPGLQCTGDTSPDRVSSHITQSTISDQWSLINETTPDQGSTVSLQCVVDSNSVPSITWTRSYQESGFTFTRIIFTNIHFWKIN